MYPFFEIPRENFQRYNKIFYIRLRKNSISIVFFICSFWISESKQGETNQNIWQAQHFDELFPPKHCTGKKTSIICIRCQEMHLLLSISGTLLISQYSTVWGNLTLSMRRVYLRNDKKFLSNANNSQSKCCILISSNCFQTVIKLATKAGIRRLTAPVIDEKFRSEKLELEKEKQRNNSLTSTLNNHHHISLAHTQTHVSTIQKVDFYLIFFLHVGNIISLVSYL